MQRASRSGESFEGPLDLNDQVCFALYSTGIAIQRMFKPILDEFGITYPQYLVLNVLWREDDQTVGAIARCLSLEPSTLTPILKRMESSGFVTRTRDPKNERQVRIHLTKQGRAMWAKVGSLRKALIEKTGMSNKRLIELSQEVGKLRDRLI